MLQIRDFTVPELDKFRLLCNFTPQERIYFELKAQDKSNVEISLEMNVSTAQVSKLAKRVKCKIIRILSSHIKIVYFLSRDRISYGLFFILT